MADEFHATGGFKQRSSLFVKTGETQQETATFLNFFKFF